MVGISFKSLMETSEKTFSPQSPVRCAYITTNVQNCVNSSIMPVVTFSSARVPTIVSNISTAFNQGILLFSQKILMTLPTLIGIWCALNLS